MLKLCIGGLVLMYLTAAWQRYRCLRAWPERIGWHRTAIIACVLQAYVTGWLLFDFHSATRTIAAVLVQLVLAPVGLIAPAITGQRSRSLVNRTTDSGTMDSGGETDVR